MKRLLILIFCLFTLQVIAQEKLHTFYVVDDSTKQAIPFVSVTIVRAQLSITTEKDGIFSIPGNLAEMRDTVIFMAPFYETTRFLLKELSSMNLVGLKRIAPIAKSASEKFKNDTLLNDFDKNNISYFAGLHVEKPESRFLQLAQLFEAPKAGSVLNHIYVRRLVFYLSSGDFIDSGYYYSQLEYTRFRLRFYDIDATTGGPGKEICNQLIEVNSSDQSLLSTDLRKYNITIPHKKFFVAIEWLRDYYNYGKVSSYSFDEQKTKDYDYYKPSIGISPKTGKKINIWKLDFAQHWKPYTEYAPFGTDLAIKVKLSY